MWPATNISKSHFIYLYPLFYRSLTYCIHFAGEPEGGRGRVLGAGVRDEAGDRGVHAAALAGVRLPAAAARRAARAPALIATHHRTFGTTLRLQNSGIKVNGVL